MIIELAIVIGGAAWLFNSFGQSNSSTYSEIRKERLNEKLMPTQTDTKIQNMNFPKIDVTKSKLADMARSRGIKYLVHFTKKENLKNIETHGLRSRQELETASLPFNFNDSWRGDGFRNTVSLSVTSPNYKMFYSLRRNNPSAEWAVILLDACKVLQNCDCAFQSTNAASNTMRGIPIAERKTLEAFASMFYDDKIRKIRNLKDNEPTDPQAEILCFDTIPPKFFKDIVFGGKFFEPRHDWCYWKKPSNDWEVW